MSTERDMTQLKPYLVKGKNEDQNSMNPESQITTLRSINDC